MAFRGRGGNSLRPSTSRPQFRIPGAVLSPSAQAQWDARFNGLFGLPATTDEERSPSDVLPSPAPVGTPFDPTCPTVTVKVGSPPTDFTVHEDVLRRSSKFLQTKAKEPWSKSGSTVDIPNHSPGAFKVYVNWLYSDKILSKPRAVGASTTSPGFLVASEVYGEWTVLAKSYVLGEELIDSSFQNSIMASLRTMSSSAHTPVIQSNIAEVVKIIYEGTPESSAARKFFAVLYSEHMSKKDLHARRDTFPADFLFDVVMHKAPENDPC